MGAIAGVMLIAVGIALAEDTPIIVGAMLFIASIVVGRDPA